MRFGNFTVIALFLIIILSGTAQAGLLDQFKNYKIEQVTQLKEIRGNLSGVTYNPETDTYFLMQNNYETIFEYNRDFSKLLRTIKLLNLEDDDTEDLVYLGHEQFGLSSEDNKVLLFYIRDHQTVVDMKISRPDVQLFQLPKPHHDNRGLEGLCYAPYGSSGRGQFFAVQESDPKKIYSFLDTSETRDFRDPQDFNAFEPFNTDVLLKHRLKDLSSCTYSEASDSILLLSDESSRIMEVSLTGKILGILDLPRVARQYEGVAINPEGHLVLVSEPNSVVIISPILK